MRLLLVPLLACAAALAVVSVALAQPQVPATFYGSVTVDGAPAPSGTEVRGLVDGVDCTQAPPGQRPVFQDGATTAYVAYVVHDSQRAGCARAGSRVSFTIGGRPAVQTAVWQPGPIRLDLSTGNQPPIPLPSPDGTVASQLQTVTAESGTAAAPTSDATLSRPTGTPPTDDVRFDQTPQPPGSGAEDPAPTADGGSSVLPVLVSVLLVLGLGAGAAGYLLSRRYRQPPAGLP